MAKVLITGMSGTGKSTVLEELGRRGHRIVDLDELGWSVDVPRADEGDAEHLWREDVVAALLGEDLTESLFVAGCASNQGSFYGRFDAVVLLSVPQAILLERIESRRTNGFGKTPAERQRILDDLEAVEPRLRATATAEIATTAPVAAVVDAIEAIAERIESRAGGAERSACRRGRRRSSSEAAGHCAG